MKIVSLSLYAIMAASSKGISLKGAKFEEINCLLSKKDLKNTSKKDIGAILIGSVIAEIFNGKDSLKLLSPQFLSVLDEV